MYSRKLDVELFTAMDSSDLQQISRLELLYLRPGSDLITKPDSQKLSNCLLQCSQLAEFVHSPWELDLRYLTTLATLPHLESLILALVDDDSLVLTDLAPILGSFSGISTLDLDWDVSPSVSPAVTHALVSLTQLQALTIRSYPWSSPGTLAAFCGGIGQLATLTHLELLSFPLLDASEECDFPEVFGNQLVRLTQLTFLALRNAKTQQWRPLIHAIAKLTALTCLDLQGSPVAADLENLNLLWQVLPQNLQRLHMLQTKLSFPHIAAFIHTLGQLSSLEVFDHFFAHDYPELPFDQMVSWMEEAGVGESAALREFKLRSTRPAVVHVSLPQLLAPMIHLEDLRLAKFELTALATNTLLSQVFPRLQSLQTLSLIHVFAPNADLSLLHHLGACTQLRSLSLYAELGLEGAQALSQIWRYLDLRELHIHSAFKQDEHAAVFFSGLANLSNLSAIGFSNNQLGDFGAQILAQELAVLSNLQYLDLSSNQIGEAGLKALELPIQQVLSRLHTFGFNRNPFVEEARVEQLIQRSTIYFALYPSWPKLNAIMSRNHKKSHMLWQIARQPFCSSSS